ncbi:MAG: GFA family protein, partial [Rhodospirillales bacterium]|nr:GFA family protein [Rhodospirillales bacterium]
MTERAATGGCLCGAVRYEAKGEPLWVAHCHCHSCRRNTGSAIATFVGYRQENFAYSAGAPAGYASSPGVTRSFCARCGTPLTYRAERFPGEVHLYISTLDDPENFRPKGHVYFAERIPWFDTADHLPRYAATSAGGAAPLAGFDAEAFLDRFAEVWQNHDLEGVAESFTEDAV